MDYSFNVEVAKRYGVEEAVFLHNLYWWIFKNEANGRHHHDGKTWTYNSQAAFAKLFPFWSKYQVQRIVKKLEANGALLIGNFNADQRDRTNWYALSDEVLEMYGETSTLQDAKPHHEGREIAPPLPDSKPDSNTPYSPPTGDYSLKGERGRFKPPTLQEVTAYCLERKNDIDPAAFIDHYAARGWRYNGNVPMKDWKAAVRTWEGKRRQDATPERQVKYLE